MPSDQNELVDIRSSDLLRDCSVGAIVRHGRTLMVVQDTRYWYGSKTHPHEREIRYVDLVKRSLALGGVRLCRPPRRQRVGEQTHGWVSARRFPEWTRCNRCGLLHKLPWRRRDGVEMYRVRADPASSWFRPHAEYRCTGQTEPQRGNATLSRCGGALEQVPWVLVHEDGYLADVPWHTLTHHQPKHPKQEECGPERNTPYLRIKKNSDGHRFVACDRCKARNRLRIPDRFAYGPSTRQQPWVRQSPLEPTDQPGWLVGVNDVRVHLPQCRTALVIPPESRIRRGTVVDRLYSSSADRKSIEQARTPLAREIVLGRVAQKYRCERKEVEDALGQLDAGYPTAVLPRGGLLQLEYKALSEPIDGVHRDEDLVTKHYSEEWRRVSGETEGEIASVAACVGRVVAVHRLKTIMVCEGFRRVRSTGKDLPKLTPPDIWGVSTWLPALELWGEGIFFTLDEKLLRRWEGHDVVQERAQEFRVRSLAARLPKRVEKALSPRFMLCHTLAHLIIRRLEAEVGYPAASLKERIYCATDDEPMAGVLIYVAVTDEHGSLGGLMEMAKPERFLRLLTGAVEDAKWCSFDPVCGEQEGHGPDLLNRAACHACALVPEPSCVCGNRLLDRAFVAGDGESLRSLWAIETSRD